MSRYSLSHLADRTLLRDLASLVARDRQTTAELLAHLAEVDTRQLYRPAAYPSMFAYCVGELRLSEDAAAKRIQAARAARQCPALFTALADGRLHLSAIVLLAPHLTPENAADLLEAATHRPKAEVERMLAERFPKPDVPASVLAIAPAGDAGQHAPGHVAEAAGGPLLGLGEANEHAPGHVAEAAGGPALSLGGANEHAPGHVRASLKPLSSQRFVLQATLREATHDKLRYAQALLGHALPTGDLAEVLDRALDALIVKLEQRRFAASARTRSRAGATTGRQVAAAVRREVWQRDGGRCTFVSDQGRRCDAHTRLELDHIEPVARGGASTPSNLRLRCRAHNQLEAERLYGAEFMQGKREQAKARRAQAKAQRRHTPAGVSGDSTAVATSPESRVIAIPARNDHRAVPERDNDVRPWLKRLGFGAAEVRRGAALCDAMPDATLEARVRFALSQLAGGGARTTAATLRGSESAEKRMR